MRAISVDRFVSMLERTESALLALPESATEEAQKQGRVELTEVRKRFARERIFGASGDAMRIPSYDQAWEAFKRARGYDMRRGHAAATGLSAVVGDHDTLRGTRDGYYVSLDNVQGTHLGMWQYFRDMKTPTLSMFKRGWETRSRKRMRKHAVRRLKAVWGRMASNVNEERGTITWNVRLRIPQFARANRSS